MGQKQEKKIEKCQWDKMDLIKLAGDWTLCPLCDWADGGEHGPEVKNRLP